MSRGVSLHRRSLKRSQLWKGWSFKYQVSRASDVGFKEGNFGLQMVIASREIALYHPLDPQQVVMLAVGVTKHAMMIWYWRDDIISLKHYDMQLYD